MNIFMEYVFLLFLLFLLFLCFSATLWLFGAIGLLVIFIFAKKYEQDFFNKNLINCSNIVSEFRLFWKIAGKVKATEFKSVSLYKWVKMNQLAKKIFIPVFIVTLILIFYSWIHPISG